MDSFEQYEKATQMAKGGAESTPPEAPKLPGPDSPPRMLDEPSITKKITMTLKDWVDFAKSLFLLVLIVLAVLFLSALLWQEATNLLTNVVETPQTIIREAPAPAVPDESRPVPVFKDVTKEMEKHKKDANWLRHLLRTEKENHATTKARLQNALQERSADEKYHRFLKYALDKFYSTPFRPDEKSRTICFTTDESDRKCYQLDRPTGWFEGRTVFPSPAKLRQL